MQIHSDKLRRTLATLHFVLLFIGYPLITSLLLPTSSNIIGISQTVTVPYRGVALGLSIIVIALCFKNQFQNTKAIQILSFYWLILIVRMLYDLHLNVSFTLAPQEKLKLWLYVFAITIVPCFAVVKSFLYIDLNKALIWLFVALNITLLLCFFSNDLLRQEATVRVSSNVALNSINTGHLGLSGLLMSLFFLSNRVKTLWQITLILPCLVLSALTLLRAGSRGPLITFIAIIFFWIFSRRKHIVRNIFLFSTAAILAVFSITSLMGILHNISPIMAARIDQTDHFRSRLPLYEIAINAFTDNPIMGKQFVIPDWNGSYTYAHNIILDSLMGMGIVGGISILLIIFLSFQYSFKLINYDYRHYWIALILVQKILENMVSGSFYFNPLFTILLAFLSILFHKNYKLKHTKPTYRLRHNAVEKESLRLLNLRTR